MKRLIALLAWRPWRCRRAPRSAQVQGEGLRGTFQYVGADGDYVTGKFGKVQLVDGKRNDKLSVHVRRLARKAKYIYRLQSAPKACAADAPGGTDVPGWKYRTAASEDEPQGRGQLDGPLAHVHGAKTGVEYFVGVYRTAATARRRARALRGATRPRRKPKHRPSRKPRQAEPSRQAGDKPAKPQATSRTPRPAEDKPRGKSEDAPARPTTSSAASPRTRRATTRTSPSTGKGRARALASGGDGPARVRASGGPPRARAAGVGRRASAAARRGRRA